MSSKGVANILIILSVLLVAGLLMGGFYIIKLRNTSQLQPLPVVSKNPVVTSQTPQPIPSSTPDETIEWKTYTDKSFTFKYPPSWNLDSIKDTVISLSTDRPTNKKATGDYTPGKGWLFIDITSTDPQEIIDRTSQSVQLDTNRQIIISGISATQLIGHRGVGGSIYFMDTILSQNGQTYVIKLETQDSDLENSLVLEFNQILSTFKLLNNNEFRILPKT